MSDVMEMGELDRDECLQLLAGASIGRVVFTQSALPTAQPVNFILDHSEIIFRTCGGGKLAAATRHAVVAFEVDEIDSRTHTGWSVVGVGEAYEVVDPVRLRRLAQCVPRPWTGKEVEHTIAIPPRIVSGRRLALAAWVSDRLCTYPL